MTESIEMLANQREMINFLQDENEAIKARIAGGVRVYAFEAWGDYKCHQYRNQTLRYC